jgi:tetratricopeptide (TPR) repeat protein
LAAILLLGLAIGCGKSGPKAPSLVEVPHPDISGFDELVRRQLQRRQAEVSRDRSYGRLGMLYHAYALYDAAEACYRNAQALEPRTFRWPYYLGKVRGEQGAWNNAVAAFEEALSIKANDVPALIGLAQAHLEANHPAEAETALKRVLAEDTACAAAHAGLGEVAALQGKHESAVRHFEAALQRQPDATAVHYSLAMAYRNLKRPGKAAEHLKKRGFARPWVPDPLMDAVRALPVGMQRRTQISEAATRSGNRVAAARELRKAVRAYPDNPVLRLNLGVALGRCGDYDGAVREFREAIRLQPGSARAHANLGVALACTGAHDDALAHFLEAVACDPQLLDGHLGLARMAVQLGKYPLGATHYARAVKIDLRNIPARIGHVVALTKAGRHADARQSLEESRKVLPDSMPLAHVAARLWATCPDERLRDGPRALELAKSLFGRYECMEHAETVAMAFAETGDYVQAQKWQKKAIEAATRRTRGNAPPRLKQNLALYESGKPCRTPWP